MTQVPKTEREWRAILSPEQFRVLRQKGTEWAGTGEYDEHFQPGVYHCAGCQAPLYTSTTSFKVGVDGQRFSMPSQELLRDTTTSPMA